MGLPLCLLSAEKLRSCGRVKRRGGAAAAAARGKTGSGAFSNSFWMTSCCLEAAAARAAVTGRGLVCTDVEAGTSSVSCCCCKCAERLGSSDATGGRGGGKGARQWGDAGGKAMLLVPAVESLRSLPRGLPGGGGVGGRGGESSKKHRGGGGERRLLAGGG